MEPEFVPPDKRLRILTLLAAVPIVVAGVIALVSLGGYLKELRKAGEEERFSAQEKTRVLTIGAAWIGGLSFLGAGAWLWQLGRRTNRHQRYPPPGMKVIFRTRVRTGPQARTIANLVELAAFACFVAGSVGMWYLYQRAAELLR